VTQDISQLLRIPPDEAERVKKRYGVALPELADRDVVLEVANPSYTASISTFELAQVIRPRVVEILDLVRSNIEQRMGALELLAGNVVVTGGASLMPGLDQVATERFRLPVRIGKPEGVSGLVDVVASPAHATAVGLVRYGMLHGSSTLAVGRQRRDARNPGPAGSPACDPRSAEGLLLMS
jgi:cell division protein FtsA